MNLVRADAFDPYISLSVVRKQRKSREHKKCVSLFLNHSHSFFLSPPEALEIFIEQQLHPTHPLTILEPQNQSIDEYYVVQKRQWADSEVPKS